MPNNISNNECDREVLAWPTEARSYDCLSKIGQGAFATVYNAKATFEECTGIGTRLCAIKVLDLEHFDTNLVEIRSEVLTMRLSNHPNVLQFYTSFVHDTQLWLVTQLMSKGSSLCCLHAGRNAGLIPRLNGGLYEPWITFILHQTLRGLDYFHENGQIHRDVKAGNILLDGTLGEVRIADFGVSGWLISGGNKREHCKTFVGTPCWMAPEVMEQVTGYDYKADIWSLGITALELAKGYAPYAKFPPMKVLLLTIQQPPPSLETYDEQFDNEDDDDDEFEPTRTFNNLPPPPPQTFSKSFREVIKMCLEKDATKRPTCKQLLAHRHFKSLEEHSILEQKRHELKTQLLDRIPDIGSSNGSPTRAHRLPGSTPIYSVTDDPGHSNRPPGTSWVFSDGSQVFGSSTNTAAAGSEKSNDDFFDEFERQTNGEAFAAQTRRELESDVTVGHSNIAPKSKPKSDNDDFFDEFERQTSGENYVRNDSH